MVNQKRWIIYSFLALLLLSASTMNAGVLSLNEQSNASNLYIIHPNGGEVVTGNMNITWRLTSYYGDEEVVFSVYYSPNAGSDWLLLVNNIFEYHYEWNTSLYETEGNGFLVRVVGFSKELGEMVAISAATFSIDNTGRNEDLDQFIQLAGFVSFLIIAAILAYSGYLLYEKRSEQETFMRFLQTSKIDILTVIKHKVTIGLDNIRNEQLESSSLGEITCLDTGISSSSVIGYFPADIGKELRSTIKGRTVLTLIEIAYQKDESRNPVKIARNLNINPSTVSKDIKLLVDLQYLETQVSEQVLRDGRYRNFRIAPKGFTFLSALSNALDAAISRLVNDRLNGYPSKG
ncbi:MAG: hypothetical protein ACFFD4_14740 [Candidatus Odinarchaeota archaeon]